MRYLSVRIPKPEPWDGVFDIEGAHRWGLPGLRCHVCGNTWATTGLCYPDVDLTGLPQLERFKSGWPVSLSEFQELCSVIRSVTSRELILRPGTEFGPIDGRIKGRCGDCEWINNWTLLFSSALVDDLKQTSLKLPICIPTNMKRNDGLSTDLLFEPALTPAIDLAESGLDLVPTCPACGPRVRVVKDVILDAKSLTSDDDIIRGKNVATHIFASERFVEFARDRKIANLEFEEIPIA